MKRAIEFKGFAPGSAEEKRISSLVDELIHRLEERASGLSQDAVSLSVVVEQNSSDRHKLYRVSANLTVPRKELAAKQEDHNVDAALRETFSALERELEDYKQRVRGEHLWKRLRKREELRERRTAAATLPEKYPETFFALVAPHLGRLNELARQEIDSAGARVTVEELAEGTLTAAWSEFVRNPAPGDIENWLRRLMEEQLQNTTAEPVRR